MTRLKTRSLMAANAAAVVLGALACLLGKPTDAGAAPYESCSKPGVYRPRNEESNGRDRCESPGVRGPALTCLPGEQRDIRKGKADRCYSMKTVTTGKRKKYHTYKPCLPPGQYKSKNEESNGRDRCEGLGFVGAATTCVAGHKREIRKGRIDACYTEEPVRKKQRVYRSSYAPCSGPGRYDAASEESNGRDRCVAKGPIGPALTCSPGQQRQVIKGAKDKCSGPKLEDRVRQTASGIAGSRGIILHPRLGGPGGASPGYSLMCNRRRNEVLVGLSGSTGMWGAQTVINRIGAVCQAVDPETGRWTGSTPRELGTGVIVSSTPFRSICPRDHAVLGFRELRTQDLVDGFTLRCRKLTPGGTISGPFVDRNRVGGNGGKATFQLCDTVYPAVGVHGRVGSAVDSIGLACAGAVPNAFQVQFQPDAIGHDWRNAYILAAFSAYSYPSVLCGGLDKNFCMQNNAQFRQRFASRFGFRQNQVVLIGEDTFQQATDTQAVVAAGEDAVFVIVRGSEEIVPDPTNPVQSMEKFVGDWLVSNPNLALRPWPALRAGAEVHSGFWEATRDRLGQISAAVQRFNPNGTKRVWVTGHSLGGAVATLLAARFQRSGDERLAVQGVYTYGQPPVGNRTFRDAYHSLFENGGRHHQRWVNGFDPVPVLIPLELGYRHVGRTNNLLQKGVTFELSGRDRRPPVTALDPLSVPDYVMDHFTDRYCPRIFRHSGLNGTLPRLKC